MANAAGLLRFFYIRGACVPSGLFQGISSISLHGEQLSSYIKPNPAGIYKSVYLCALLSRFMAVPLAHQKKGIP